MTKPKFPRDTKMKRSMTQMGMELRCYVLYHALHIETITQMMLGTLLHVDQKKSKAFGHTSSAIGFDTRVQVLMELGALTEEERTKLSYFLKFRNQLMHNVNANTVSECLRFMDMKESTFLKHFPQDTSLSKDQQLLNALIDLTQFSNQCATKVMQHVLDLIAKDSQRLVDLIDYSAIQYARGNLPFQRRARGEMVE